MSFSVLLLFVLLFGNCCDRLQQRSVFLKVCFQHTHCGLVYRQLLTFDWPCLQLTWSKFQFIFCCLPFCPLELDDNQLNGCLHLFIDLHTHTLPTHVKCFLSTNTHRHWQRKWTRRLLWFLHKQSTTCCLSCAALCVLMLLVRRTWTLRCCNRTLCYLFGFSSSCDQPRMREWEKESRGQLTDWDLGSNRFAPHSVNWSSPMLPVRSFTSYLFCPFVSLVIPFSKEGKEGNIDNGFRYRLCSSHGCVLPA